MKTFYLNLVTDTLEVQSVSDAPRTIKGTVAIQFDFVLENSPILNDNIKDSLEFKLAVVRALRDKYLLDTIWINERHLSQLVEDRSLTESTYQEWQNYWQLLRDLPAEELPNTLAELLDILPTQPED